MPTSPPANQSNNSETASGHTIKVDGSVDLELVDSTGKVAGTARTDFDGFFLYGFFLAFDEADHDQEFTPEVRDTSRRDFDWLETLWRRSLVAHRREPTASGALREDVVIAKVFSLSTQTSNGSPSPRTVASSVRPCDRAATRSPQ